jgi:hypothetical protein
MSIDGCSQAKSENGSYFLQEPDADTKQIKQAYYNLMREFHPDSSSIDTTDFCALLNEIYAVSNVVPYLSVSPPISK